MVPPFPHAGDFEVLQGAREGEEVAADSNCWPQWVVL
jgi:hypothetical protein